MFLAACQPTVEERIENAEAYLAREEYRAAAIELRNVLQAQPDLVSARLMLAEASAALDDFATAEAQYRRALELGESDVATWVGYGRSLLALGRAQEALETVVPNLESASGDAAAAIVQGNVYAALGNADAAMPQYRRALDLDTDNAEALVGLGAAAVFSGDLDLATASFDRAVEAHSGSPMVYRARGDYLLARQDSVAAVADYEQATTLATAATPSSERYRARYGLVAARIDAGQFEAASEALEELSRLAPNTPVLQFLRGQIAFGQSDYDLAETEMLNYLSVVPEDPRAQAILGAISFSNNNLLQAEQYLSTAVRASVGGDRARMLLAETQMRLDKSDAAIANLEQANGTGQSGAVILQMLGRASLNEGDADTAIDYFERSAALSGDSDSVNLVLAASYFRAGRFAEVIETLSPMPLGVAENYQREVLLISAYIQQEQPDMAVALARDLVRERPEDPDAHALVGVLYLNTGDSERGMRHLGRALELDPQSTSALYSLGLTAAAEGRFPAAVGHIEQVLDQEPAHLPALVQFVTMVERSGELERADERVAAALEAAPSAIAIRKLAARINLLQGRIPDALAEIERGIADFPNDAGFTYLKGVAEIQSGDLAQGLSDLEQAAEAQPDNASFQYELARARLANREFARALAAARAYRTLRPADVRGLAVEVDAQLRVGAPERARAAIDAFATAYPDQDFVTMLYGDVELASGNGASALDYYSRHAEQNWDRAVVLRLVAVQAETNPQQALQVLERWLGDQPEDAEMRRVYGQLLETSGNTGGAVAQYERLAEDGVIDAVGLNNLAWQYMLQGREEAVELAERAHALQPDNGSIADTLGWILFQNGETERAIPFLRRATELTPDNPEIRYHLAAALSDAGQRDEARAIVEQLIESDARFPSRPEAERLANGLQ